MSRIFEQKFFELGTDEIERPTGLGDLARGMHTQIIGSTGVGKTESVILPLILNDAICGKSIIFIDPKGDSNTFQKLQSICAFARRAQDLVRIDLSCPEKSDAYNPLKIGTPAELKDKITGSILWTEEFYKKVSERFLLQAFLVLKHTGVEINLVQFSDFFNFVRPFSKIFNDASDALKSQGQAFANEIKASQNLEGVKTDLKLWTESGFQRILSQTPSDSAFDWICKKKIVYINLNTLAFEETARRFGRLILQDIKTAVQELQKLPKDSRSLTSVFIDEFASVASSGFIELLNKARSAGVQLSLAHQSLGDLQGISQAFCSQVLDNTNAKIIFRLDGPDTADFFARLIGTRKSEKKTFQVSHQNILGAHQTGLGTSRETEEFIISPNQFRTLERGVGIILTKIPYSIAKCSFYSIDAHMDRLNKLDLTRRIKWPSIIKGVS